MEVTLNRNEVRRLGCASENSRYQYFELVWFGPTSLPTPNPLEPSTFISAQNVGSGWHMLSSRHEKKGVTISYADADGFGGATLDRSSTTGYDKPVRGLKGLTSATYNVPYTAHYCS